MASPGAAVVPAPTAFDNASMLHNLTQWTLLHLRLPVNVTRYAEDLFLAGPRMLTKLGSIISYADTVDGFGQRVIPDPTGSDIFLTTAAGSTTAHIAADASVAAAAAAELVDQDPGAMASRLSLEGAKGLGSVFSYATSKWALCCVAMAIILNRTHIFAASRHRLRLGWHVRLFLRFLPLVLFLFQAQRLLQSIQCQTSPDFSELRWGNASKTSDLMFTEPGGYLHTISSTLLLGASDMDSCLAVNMVPDDEQVYPAELQGSLSLLWPLFGTFCLSHFLETVSCAVQGRPVAVETGMTLFEHSLAFAEADAAVSNQLGWGLFSSGGTANVTLTGSTGTSIAISRSMIMKRVNTPPEVLLVAFLSAMSHVTSHLLGVFNLQARYRLLSTGFWALCFMSSIVYEAFNFSLDDPANMGLFRFPTVCIIGFIPHVMVFVGIFICALIYCIALVLSALSPPDGMENLRQLTFFQRLRVAHENMQANISLSDIRVSRDMDFYTALLRIGFGVITMASEAVYLNEDRRVNIKQLTWLEEERFKELENFRMQWSGSSLGDSRYDPAGTVGLIPVKDDQATASNGFARERAAQKIPKARAGDKRAKDGIGAIERSSRWILAMDFIININRLILRWSSLLILRALARVGIRSQPRFLLWLHRRPLRERKQESEAGNTEEASSSRQGAQDMLFNDEDVDMESEMMMRLRHTPETANMTWADIDKRLYQSWKDGALWGSADTSGAWEPESDAGDWDTTSLLESNAGSDVGFNTRDQFPWEDDEDYLDDGQRTPTQQSRFTREPTPSEASITMGDIARLLNPRTADERQEAQALAAHLTSDRIMTRSAYARQQAAQRTRLLTTATKPGRDRNRRLTSEEEAELLEQLIISRRTAPRQRPESRQIEHGNQENTGSWAVRDENGGGNGPQCVVCYNEPRTIIVWPCRCLSLCDGCRVSLAMNNFDKCVCCRREVISFSRIYVP
ncbi:hypothetical protein KJ359_003524 [Pestalotiopsis sp. 9143b]|nr:hypothetical protein KJ359_003524 [Pestalotiopsis sp. 9143b]